MTRRAVFHWAVVGNGSPEPVAVIGKRGGRKAYTIGCPDAFEIDKPGCPCRLLPKWGQDAKDNRYIAKVKLLGESEAIKPPQNILSRKVRQGLEALWTEELRPKHGYAGFGRSKP